MWDKKEDVFMFSKEKSMVMLFNYVALLMAILAFATGRFGLTSILGVKRQTEIALLLILGPLGFFALLKPRLYKDPLFLLPLVFFAGEALQRRNPFQLMGLIVAILMVGLLIGLPQNFSNTVLKCIIRVAGIFAIMGIIQFVIIFFNPALIPETALLYDDYAEGNQFIIQNSMQVLGLTTGEEVHLFGKTVTRLRSFTSEPSLLVAYFLLPGALALTFANSISYWGIPIIVFSVLSLSGSVFLTILFSLISFLILKTKKNFIYKISPFIAMAVFVYLVNVYGLGILLSPFKWVGGFDFLSRTSSATIRISATSDLMKQIIDSPLGVSQPINIVSGLFIRSLAQSGVAGFLIIAIITFKLFGLVGKLINFNKFSLKKLNNTQIAGLLLISGILFTALTFNDYGFVGTGGFILITLLCQRLKYLAFTLTPESQSKHS